MPPASERKRKRRGTQESLIGACLGCGAVLHAWQLKKSKKWCIDSRSWWVESDHGPRDAQISCARCGSLAIFPREQDVLLAAFALGGWDAVSADMFGPEVKGAMTAREAEEAIVGAIADALIVDDVDWLK